MVMNMARLIIERQDAAIEITTRRAQISIQTPSPKMTVKSTAPRMVVRRSLPQVRYNPNPKWQNRGTGVYTAKGMMRYVEPEVYSLPVAPQNAAQMGNGQVNAAMRRNSVHLALQRSARPSPVQSMQNAVNERRAHMEWDLGSMQIDWEMGGTEINWEIGRPIIEVEPYAIEIKMRRYPKVMISYMPSNQRKTTGRRLDRLI